MLVSAAQKSESVIHIPQLVSFYLQLDMHFYSSSQMLGLEGEKNTLAQDSHPYLHIRALRRF